jgi:hypothetical protein
MAGGAAQLEKHLPRKCEAQGSIPTTEKGTLG